MTKKLAAWLRLQPAPIHEEPLLAALAKWLGAEETREALRACDRQRAYPERLVAQARDLGLVDLLMDGGVAPGRRSSVTVPHLSAVNFMAARCGGSLAITIGVNFLALLPVNLSGTDQQRAQVRRQLDSGALSSMLLTEQRHGSNLLGNEAFAERGIVDPEGAFVAHAGTDFSHYRLAGHKDTINGGSRHGVLVSLLRTRKREERVEGPLAARGDFSLFVVPRDRTVVATHRWHTLPAKAADISSLAFAGTVVPRAALLESEGDGFPLVQKTLAFSRGGISALACGASSWAVEHATAYARQRSLAAGAGDARPAGIVALGAIAHHLVKAAALDLIAATTSLRSIAMMNAFGVVGAPSTAVSKLLSCELAELAVTECRKVLGGRALLVDDPFETVIRDVLLYGVFDGTSHVMLEQIQSRLATMAGPGPSLDDGEAPRTLDALGAMYRTAPRAIRELGRTDPSASPPGLWARVVALESVDPKDHVAALPALVEALLLLVRHARTSGAWAVDHALRFELASTFAGVEGLVALTELADPKRRGRLGLETSVVDDPVDVAGYRFAWHWWAAQLTQRIRAHWQGLGASSAGPRAASFGGLEGLEAALQRELLVVRRIVQQDVEQSAR